MFNKVIISPKTNTEHIPYCREIKEIKAPTDDSIRLYAEIKEKAYSSILSTIELRDNSFNLNAIMYRDNFSMDNVCKYIFSLNGKKIQDEIRSSELDIYNKNDLIKNIFEKVSKTLAIELCNMIIKKL